MCITAIWTCFAYHRDVHQTCHAHRDQHLGAVHSYARRSCGRAGRRFHPQALGGRGESRSQPLEGSYPTQQLFYVHFSEEEKEEDTQGKPRTKQSRPVLQSNHVESTASLAMDQCSPWSAGEQDDPTSITDTTPVPILGQMITLQLEDPRSPPPIASLKRAPQRSTSENLLDCP